MLWTETAYWEYARASMLYASDLNERKWELVAPSLPPSKSIGRPRATELREMSNAIFYIASSGCRRRMLLKNFPLPRPSSAISTTGTIVV
jgi:hypothetical protein